MNDYPRFDGQGLRAPEALYTEPHWYACYTRARHEKKVAELLRGKEIESYVPLLSKLNQWKDRQKRVEVPLFPGYVFGRFTLRDVHAVLITPGVSTIIRTNGIPAPIADEDIENVRGFAHALQSTGAVPEPRPFFAEGERVRVKSGPFEGVHGRVVEGRGRGRILIGLEAIGQGLEIDIDARLLVPAPPAA